MAFAFSKPRVSPIAIDLGVDSVKMLQLVPGEPPQLLAAGAAAIPERARSDADARLAFLADAIPELLRSQPFKGRRVMLSLPACQTLVQNLALPAGDKPQDVAQQVMAQLRERLNVEPTRMVVRHFIVGPVTRDGSPMQEVLCLAASRDVVMRYVDLCNRLKLDVVGMHSEPAAILRAFDHMHREGDKTAVGYVDIGAATTKVVFAHGRRIVFAKTLHAAGDHITRQVAAAQKIDFADARALRIAQAGSRSNQAAPAAAAQSDATAVAVAEGQPQPQPAANADKAAETDTVECLVDELQLCLRYHQSLFADSPIERLVFLGGESRNTRICQTIARSVRIAAQLGDPLARIARISQAKAATGVNLDQPQPGWAVPVGLCLSEANL